MVETADETAEKSSPRARIVDAAENLLREGGADAVTTRAVAQRAGVPAPTIFRIFGDKDGLMESVAEQVLARYVTAKAQQVADERGDPVDALRAAWRTHVDFGLANPDLFVLLSAPGPHADSPAAVAGTQALATRVARVATAGRLRVAQERAVQMIQAAGNGVVLTLLARPETERDPALADAVIDTTLRGIVTQDAAPPASDLAPLAVAARAAVPELPALSDAERTLLTEWLDRSVAALQEGAVSPGP
ncbi:TetR/AcrR family transcriptional regulator [Promicromonospora citrea]|uniref:TetR family transcriptional regulator n=1 Tax=Promicromonospora citrea TaxID=43677 RepID=A0A8H9GMW1_9MICO|nr:TetR/AcrR family transcriptional regulator [Promicromonospora citrea]NNH54305.1 TetR/AcrR family transcriptional regulator [Promicromonospora citrea]GGM38205.1 TetR family transcriptional regulator [Promicromonospora citrea]